MSRKVEEEEERGGGREGRRKVCSNGSGGLE